MVLTDPAALECAARALAAGDVVAHGFANFYALTTRPDAASVRAANVMKGRPAGQVGSVVTTPSRVPLLFDWSALPPRVSRRRILAAVDALFCLGPCGFRGAAAGVVPDHLVSADRGVRTVQLIGPGYACPSLGFVARALAAVDEDLLHITSANRSHHRTGAADEPAHYRADALAAEFAGQPGFRLLAHADERAARRAYPQYATTSVTLLSWHRSDLLDRDRPTLVVERHGSLSFAAASRVLGELGFDLVLGPRASERLRPRRYEDRDDESLSAPAGLLGAAY